MDTRNVKRNFTYQKRKQGQRSTGGRAPRKSLSTMSSRQKKSSKSIPKFKMIDKRPNVDLSQSGNFQLEDNTTKQIATDISKRNTSIQNLEPEKTTKDQKIQAYSSENDVQTQTPVPNENGFCAINCPYIMTGMLCGPFCRFTPN